MAHQLKKSNTVQYLTQNISDDAVASTIKEKILSKTPYALSRLGDGEIYLINDNAPESLIQKICELWRIPRSLYEKFRLKTVENILNPMIQQTDILGLLSPTNEVCQTIRYDSKKWSLPVQYVKELRSDIPHICDHLLPRSKAFGDINNFKDILSGRSLNIISPNVELLNKDLSTILDASVNITIISNDRSDLLRKLDMIKEEVVIYGASLTGKDIGVILKKQGKVCIDFGATLDAWANISSRQWFQVGGLQRHCVIE